MNKYMCISFINSCLHKSLPRSCSFGLGMLKESSEGKRAHLLRVSLIKCTISVGFRDWTIHVNFSKQKSTLHM
jgi:hypothetical protein